MPTYTFEDKETGEVFDKLMKISEKEQYLKDNPNLKPVLTAPNFVGDHIVKRMDGGMKEVFSKIADAHPNGKRPFSRSHYIEKFKSLTDGIISQKESKIFLNLVQNLKALKAKDLKNLNIQVVY